MRLLALAALLAAAPAGAALKVVATIPDLADVARRVGGDRVSVDSLAKGTEDLHSIPQRPSFLPRLNRADALVVLGLDAEHAFLPALLQVAQNVRILPGEPGHIDCSRGLRPLDVPALLDRSEGEQHAHGNPHFNVDPRNGALIADNLAEGFARLDPAGAAAYRANAAAFKKELAARIESWRKAAAPLKGVKAVSQHRDMVYFADFLGLVMIGELEPKPGIPPTPKHLAALAERMKAEGARVIIREAQFGAAPSRFLAEKTGAKVANVAIMAGAFPDAKDYFGMIEHNVSALLEAAK
jgi:zinc/manganese transport system substrate-binding protein